MRRRRKDQNGEYNYWQPATDMMTGLVFVLMLIVALLGLYLLSDYTGYKYDETEGVEETTAQETRPDDDGWSWKEYKGNGDHEDVGDGAGDGGGSGQEQPIIQTGGGGYGDEGIKSAVFTELVDDETDRIIPDEGVRFELYRTDWGLQNGMGALQILNTYYPEKISYREYETTEEGVFYLPEKIYQGDYFFRELNEPEGYDAAGDTYFNLDKMYDWPDPFVVQIRVSPSKNVIRVQMSDLLSKDPVGGGTFQVRAAEDVATLDGTVRYIAGQLVDTITCDENGYGESKELYLGSYTLEQAGIPRYYAGINEQPEALVEKKNGEEPPIHEIDTEKTNDGRLLLRFNDKGFQDPFYSQQMSDGTLKVFAYLLLLEDPTPPPFLCIEEPENGLYHKLLESLAKEFREHATGRKGGSQVFITTHQPYLVDALEPAEVWILEKGSDGYSVIRRASDDTIVKNMVAEGLPLGGLWYSDYLDAR